MLAGFCPPVPAAAVARVLALGPHTTPAEPRRSASVVLLRDGPGGLVGASRSGGPDALAGPAPIDVYLLHRHERMPFAPGVAVFPGGGLEPGDARSADPVLACALRETEEETTVRLEAHELVPWARWVTPEHEPRRYDTTFYLARVPGGQQARDVSGETVRAGWTPVADAFAARAAGALALLAPTWSVLLEVGAAPDLATLLDRGRDRRVEAVLPRVVRTDMGWRFAYGVVG